MGVDLNPNPCSTVSGYHAEYGYGQYSSPSAYQQQQQHYYNYHAPYHASYTALPPSTSGSAALNNSSGSNSNSSGVTNTANRNEFGSIRLANKNHLSIKKALHWLGSDLIIEKSNNDNMNLLGKLISAVDKNSKL